MCPPLCKELKAAPPACYSAIGQSMDELLIPVDAKIKRAEKHISDFNSAAELFVRDGGYSVTGDRDPETREPFYYVSEAGPIPPTIMVIVGDAIQNLRTALDYVARALVVANGKTPTTATAFPIVKDPQADEARFLSKVEGMRKEAIEAIRAEKPYRGGDQTLWCLHHFSNVDKHRVLLTAGAAIHGFNAGQHTRASVPRNLPGGDPYIVDSMERKAKFMRAMPDGWAELPTKIDFPLKKGDKLFIDFPDFEINENVQFSFFIAFDEKGTSLWEGSYLSARRFPAEGSEGDCCAVSVSCRVYPTQLVTLEVQGSRKPGAGCPTHSRFFSNEWESRHISELGFPNLLYL